MRCALLACAEPEERKTILSVLRDAYRVDTVRDGAECLQQFRARRYDVTFIDLACLGVEVAAHSDVDYDRELAPFWEAFPTADVVILARNSAVREAVRAVRAGASDYLTFPIHPAELRFALESLRGLSKTEAELEYLRDEFWKSDWCDVVRTQSPAMRDAIRQVQLVAPTRTTVLLTGETGTGKGVLAKLIHQHSNRVEKQFVSVHCGAIPDTLLESELFGHEKGAFTGATRRRLGKFEIASGGTILLDEVGTLTPAAQIKLLQVLQERTVQRVGSDAQAEVDARVIAATNTDLGQLCDKGEFRRDLFFRLNVFPISVPPLRERVEDIPLLAGIFIERFNQLNNAHVRDVSPAVMSALQRYSWPGNVREMENLFERAFILARGPVLEGDSFPQDLVGTSVSGPAGLEVDVSLSLEAFHSRGTERLQERYLRAQLAANGGRIDQTAKVAGISTRYLSKLMRKYGLRKEEFRRADVRPDDG